MTKSLTASSSTVISKCIPAAALAKKSNIDFFHIKDRKIADVGTFLHKYTENYIREFLFCLKEIELEDKGILEIITDVKLSSSKNTQCEFCINIDDFLSTFKNVKCFFIGKIFEILEGIESSLTSRIDIEYNIYQTNHKSIGTPTLPFSFSEVFELYKSYDDFYNDLKLCHKVVLQLFSHIILKFLNLYNYNFNSKTSEKEIVKIYLEKPCYDKNDDYIGRPDFVAEFQNKFLILDFKFGYKKVSPMQSSQLKIYASHYLGYEYRKNFRMDIGIMQPRMPMLAGGSHYELIALDYAEQADCYIEYLKLLQARALFKIETSLYDGNPKKRLLKMAVAGEHCFLCNYKDKCEKFADEKFNLVKQSLPKLDNNNINNLSNFDKYKMLKDKKLFLQIFDEIENSLKLEINNNNNELKINDDIVLSVKSGRKSKSIWKKEKMDEIENILSEQGFELVDSSLKSVAVIKNELIKNNKNEVFEYLKNRELISEIFCKDVIIEN